MYICELCIIFLQNPWHFKRIMGPKLKLYIHINLLKSLDESEKTPTITSTNRKKLKTICVNCVQFKHHFSLSFVCWSKPINFACILHLPAVNVLWISLCYMNYHLYFSFSTNSNLFFNAEEFMAWKEITCGLSLSVHGMPSAYKQDNDE